MGPTTIPRGHSVQDPSFAIFRSEGLTQGMPPKSARVCIDVSAAGLASPRTAVTTVAVRTMPSMLGGGKSGASTRMVELLPLQTAPPRTVALAKTAETHHCSSVIGA